MDYFVKYNKKKRNLIVKRCVNIKFLFNHIELNANKAYKSINIQIDTFRQ